MFSEHSGRGILYVGVPQIAVLYLVLFTTIPGIMDMLYIRYRRSPGFILFTYPFL